MEKDSSFPSIVYLARCMSPEQKAKFRIYCIFTALQAYSEGEKNNTMWLVNRYQWYKSGHYSRNAYMEILAGFIMGRSEIQ